MNKFYISFGQVHVHKFGRYLFDKDTLAEITVDGYLAAREKAIKLFGQKFASIYDHQPNMKYFPKGVFKI